MTIRFWTPVVALALICVHGSIPLTADSQASPSSSTSSSPHDFRGLEPGKFVQFQHEVPVDIVLIGFDDLAVDQNDLRTVLPARYAPSCAIRSSMAFKAATWVCDTPSNIQSGAPPAI